MFRWNGFWQLCKQRINRNYERNNLKLRWSRGMHDWRWTMKKEVSKLRLCLMRTIYLNSFMCALIWWMNKRELKNWFKHNWSSSVWLRLISMQRCYCRHKSHFARISYILLDKLWVKKIDHKKSNDYQRICSLYLKKSLFKLKFSINKPTKWGLHSRQRRLHRI